MRRTLFILFSILLVSSLSINAQMRLSLSQELTGERPTSLMENNLESNLKLELPPEATAPANFDFKKGLILLGLAADVTLPLGDDFTNWAGTAFSGHVVLSYLIAKSFMVALQAGYVRFGEKTQESITGFEGEHSKWSWTHSQIPILLAAYYLFNTGSSFRPYIGLAFGLFLLQTSWKYEWNYFDQSQVDEGDDSDTKFGIAPTLGFYYAVSAALLINVAIQYMYIFHKAGGDGSSNITQLGFLFGVMFALGK